MLNFDRSQRLGLVWRSTEFGRLSWAITEELRFSEHSICIHNYRSIHTDTGRCHRKSVRQMADFPNFPISQQHLDDVEAGFHRRMFEQLEIVQRGLRKQAALAGDDDGNGTRSTFSRLLCNTSHRQITSGCTSCDVAGPVASAIRPVS